MASKRNNPCMEALRSKYKVSENWFREAPRKYASHTWKAVERMKQLVSKGACFLVGDGSLIDVWKDLQVPWLPNFLPKSKAPLTYTEPLKVTCLIDPTLKCWIDTKLYELFDEETIEAIKKISIPPTPISDKLVWILNSKGTFSVKSTYTTSQHIIEEDDGGLWKKLWKLKIHERFKGLLWQIASGILPTRFNLSTKLGWGDTNCPLCDSDEESIEHLFFHCTVARAIWFGTSWVVHSNQLAINSPIEIIKLISDLPIYANSILPHSDILIHTIIQFVTTLDCIWTRRNHVVHKDSNFNMLVVIKNLEARIMEHINTLAYNEDLTEPKEMYLAVWKPP